MPQFRDNAGRTWTVELNVDAIKRVRSLLGLDLLGEAPTLLRLAADPVLLVDTLFVVCRPEANERYVTDEDFGRAMAGDALGAAAEALTQALSDFYQSPRDRARARRIAELTGAMIEETHEVLDARLAATPGA